jgi:hypothetical protein
MQLLEAGHLLKDPTTIVWTPTSGMEDDTQARDSAIVAVLRSTAKNKVKDFVALYVRAHAKLPST